MNSARVVSFTGAGAIVTDSNTTFTLSGPIAGAGEFTKDGAGTLAFTGDGSGFAGATRLSAGVLAVDGALSGPLEILAAGRLEGGGRVGAVTNRGVVAPGRAGDFGALTIAGDYVGAGGALEIETKLSDDASPTDRLVVTGATSGATTVDVVNRGGLGGATVEGVKIIDVAGASNGVFTLQGDYLFAGQPTVIAGAFGYRLYKNGVTDPADGDWYLRSSLLNPPEPPPPSPSEPSPPPSPPAPPPPLYQPGVPVYEAYPQTLLSLNGLPTLQQRAGNRSWAGAHTDDGEGVWGRTEAARERPNAPVSTSATDIDLDRWLMQIGFDRALARTAEGGVLMGGVAMHYAEANAEIQSPFGGGEVETHGFGLDAALTWYGSNGFYVDSQASVSSYDSKLASKTLGALAKGIEGDGAAFSVETGKRLPLGGGLSVTPQVQAVYSHVAFDGFTDPAQAMVSDLDSDSLKTRLGVSLDHQRRGPDGGRHLYGLVNLTYEWLDGTRVDVSSTPIAHRDHRLWGELGLGGSQTWDHDRKSIYAEVSADTALGDFGESYGLKGVVGLLLNF